MLTHVTAVSATDLSHGSGSLWNPSGGGTLPTFTQGAYVFDLGQTPTWRTYSISGNRLQSLEVLNAPSGVSAVTLLSDIVDLGTPRHRRPLLNGSVFWPSVWEYLPAARTS
jgi:hypothetical protein